MKHYYLLDKTQPRGFIEVTEAEYIALVGDENTRYYAQDVYRGIISIDKVPEEYREEVSTIVQNKIARFGIYNISDSEALNIITGGN